MIVLFESSKPLRFQVGATRVRAFVMLLDVHISTVEVNRRNRVPHPYDHTSCWHARMINGQLMKLLMSTESFYIQLLANDCSCNSIMIAPTAVKLTAYGRYNRYRASGESIKWTTPTTLR